VTVTAEPPPVRELYRLRPDAEVRSHADGGLAIRQSRFEMVLDLPGLSRRALVIRLGEEWLDDIEANRIVMALEGEGRILSAQVLLRRLVAHSWLSRRLQVGDRPLLDLLPRALGPGSLPAPLPADPGTPYTLSRFATLRAEAGQLIAAAPTSTVACAIPDAGLAAALVALSGPGCDQAGLAAASGVTPRVAGRLLDELATAGVLVSPAGATAEGHESPQMYWSAEELGLHERSRPGRHSAPVGGTYRFRTTTAPAPLAYRRTGVAGPIALPVPDLDLVAKADESLTEVIRARRSLREHDDDHPITLAQLAEFLYRVQHTESSGDAGGQELGRRPYPCGGGLCELELYALVTNCAGLAPGLYHYASVDHELTLVSPNTSHADRVLSYARAASATTSTPQVLLGVTARVNRLMWKYEGLGYAMSLKHTGVLTELMYLVATAMRLAPCALGAGDSAAFARLAGLDPVAEPHVADFLLGSRLELERA
jgi:SagB-type dehydrogenase family enzyme